MVLELKIAFYTTKHCRLFRLKTLKKEALSRQTGSLLFSQNITLKAPPPGVLVLPIDKSLCQYDID